METAAVVGRFAPSPTGQLHLGNLRTALVAWLSARAAAGRFVVRMEDLDRVTSRRELEVVQLDELAAIGLDWDGDVVRQSERFERYEAAIAMLVAADWTYECFCTRREIREAASAPHHPPDADGRYPGTCRRLSAAARAAKRADGRRPALRLLADGHQIAFEDAVVGRSSAAVDDIVLRRNDGVPAYNLAVVVDDAAQGVTEVVRGDDLLSSTPSQIHLGGLLGLPTPRYAHVPLAIGPDGTRLAKRHGAVTLEQLAERGHSPVHVLGWLATSLGLAGDGERVTSAELIDRFEITRLPREPWCPVQT
jgi:glutamyl-tRNA synthetase